MKKLKLSKVSGGNSSDDRAIGAGEAYEVFEDTFQKPTKGLNIDMKAGADISIGGTLHPTDNSIVYKSENINGEVNSTKTKNRTHWSIF